MDDEDFHEKKCQTQVYPLEIGGVILVGVPILVPRRDVVVLDFEKPQYPHWSSTQLDVVKLKGHLWHSLSQRWGFHRFSCARQQLSQQLFPIQRQVCLTIWNFSTRKCLELSNNFSASAWDLQLVAFGGPERKGENSQATVATTCLEPFIHGKGFIHCLNLH